MLAGFICPDNQTVNKEDCYNKCRLGNPCRSLRYLLSAGYDREYKGTVSCTQLLNGTRMEYLKIKYPYFIKPDDRAYAILGTRSHWRLDEISKSREDVISEYFLDGDQAGTLDCLEKDRTNGGYILVDNKTWGAYSVKKALNNDFWETEMQLNFYRVKAEHDSKLREIVGHEIHVNKMIVEAIVRDGGIRATIEQGITERIYSIPVKRYDDDEVMEYFNSKAFALQEAIRTDTMPKVCSSVENWNFRKCRGMCDVYQFCNEGRKINKT